MTRPCEIKKKKKKSFSYYWPLQGSQMRMDFRAGIKSKVGIWHHF